VTERPNIRSAITVSSTSPPAITDCTSEIGASARAPTWNPHDPIETTMPSMYQPDPNSTRELRTGRRKSTAGARTAPRCL
jgi:hypothetical protein